MKASVISLKAFRRLLRWLRNPKEENHRWLRRSIRRQRRPDRQQGLRIQPIPLGLNKTASHK